MRNFIYRLFLILLFTLINIQLLDFIAINGQKPDILLILVIFLAQRRGIMDGQISGFFTGLLEDIFSIKLLGLHSFIKLIVGYLAGFLHNNLVLDRIPLQFILGFIASLVHGILFILTKSLFDHLDIKEYILGTLWLKVIYTAFLTPLLFAFLEFLDKRFGEA